MTAIAPRSNERKIVLVVEDAEAIRKLVCTTLSNHGYECLEAEDGAEALQMITDGASDVDLVLTDMVMPRMGGKELSRHLSLVRPDIRIMFMSGYTEDPVIRDLEQNESLFLAKPFTSAVLTDKIRSALDRPWSGLPQR